MSQAKIMQNVSMSSCLTENNSHIRLQKINPDMTQFPVANLTWLGTNNK